MRSVVPEVSVDNLRQAGYSYCIGMYYTEYRSLAGAGQMLRVHSPDGSSFPLDREVTPWPPQIVLVGPTLRTDLTDFFTTH